MDNLTDKVQEALKTIRREVEDCKDWSELYGLDGELRELADQSEDRLADMSDG